MENTKCPNCSQPIKSGWGGNKLVAEALTNYLNTVLNKNASNYCDDCSSDLLKQASKQYNQEKEELSNFIKLNIGKIPVVTTHSPFGWNYTPLSIVTGQSVTGTGFISEFKSSFTDFFGSQSGSFNKKISDGEKLCFAQLRSKTLALGGNAVIATDIDYGDVGQGKGMLLVCAAGTAVKINNTEILGDTFSTIESMKTKSARLTEINLAYKKYMQP